MARALRRRSVGRRLHHSTERRAVRGGRDRARRASRIRSPATWTRGSRTTSREIPIRGEQLADRGRPAAKRGQPRAGAGGAREPEPVDEGTLAGRALERRRRGSAAGGSGGAARGPLHLLLVAVGLVLLVACVNVANLVLVRATGRVHEFAIRSALGSGARRLVRQLLVESLLLAGLGGLLGLALAASRGQGAAGSWPRRPAAARRGRIRSCGAGIRRARSTVATAVAFGVAPALRFGRISPDRRRFASSRAPPPARAAQGRLRSGLAAAQLALALTLLVGAGVLLASFYRLQQVDLGFRVDGVLTFEVNLPTVRYDAERRAAFQEELARRLRTIPGVTAAGGISFLPATGSYHAWNTVDPQRPARRDAGGAGETDSTSSSARSAATSSRRSRFRCLRAARSTRATMPARRRARWSAPTSPGAAFPGMPFDGVVGQRISAGGRRRSRSSASSATSRSTSTAHRRSSSITRIASSRTTGTGRSRRSWRRSCPPERMLAQRAGRGRGAGSRTGRPPGGADDRRRRPGHEPRAIRARPDGSVRRRVAAARRARSLRRARLRRAPAHAGDWHPDGARRDRRAGTRAGLAAGRASSLESASWPAPPARWCSAAG